jgi:hypothetical protein
MTLSVASVVDHDRSGVVDHDRGGVADTERLAQVEERNELRALAPEEHVGVPARSRIGGECREGDHTRVVHGRSGGGELREGLGAAGERDEVVVDSLDGAS